MCECGGSAPGPIRRLAPLALLLPGVALQARQLHRAQHCPPLLSAAGGAALGCSGGSRGEGGGGQGGDSGGRSSSGSSRGPRMSGPLGAPGRQLWFWWCAARKPHVAGVAAAGKAPGAKTSGVGSQQCTEWESSLFAFRAGQLSANMSCCIKYTVMESNKGRTSPWTASWLA